MDVSISLTPELLGFLDAKVQSGRYDSPSEVVAEALRLLSDRDETAFLRAAYEEGIASGESQPLDFAEIRQAAWEKLQALRKGSVADCPIASVA